jgi:hypothetical protein
MLEFEPHHTYSPLKYYFLSMVCYFILLLKLYVNVILLVCYFILFFFFLQNVTSFFCKDYMLMLYYVHKKSAFLTSTCKRFYPLKKNVKGFI